ncbi:hypothetical protein BDN67DRAFT_984816 [Paxillus ammoniavirescens]|nr:hypothetical protein BDN67DRAFT_984816 [Paxillus ammoniavirescens]
MAVGGLPVWNPFFPSLPFFHPTIQLTQSTSLAMLSSILKPTAPINPLEAQKSAAKDAFAATAAKVHAVAMSRPGDGEGLEEERRMWMEEWRAVTPGMMAAHQRAQEVGIETPIPPTVLQEMNLADEAFKKMQDAAVGPTAPISPARVGSPMAQDPADEPPRAFSPFPSISSRATGCSKMEVMIDKGKGRKEVVALQARVLSSPDPPTAAKAGPSTRGWAPTASDEEEDEGLEIVMKAGPKEVKGKGKGRAISLSMQESDELMKLVMTLEAKVRDAQARLLELESEVLTIKGLLECRRG